MIFDVRTKERRKVEPSALPKKCDTISCKNTPTQRMTYTMRDDPETIEDDLCEECAKGYARRPVIHVISIAHLAPSI